MLFPPFFGPMLCGWAAGGIPPGQQFDPVAFLKNSYKAVDVCLLAARKPSREWESPRA